MKFNFYQFIINLMLKKVQPVKKLESVALEEIDTILLMSNTAIGDTIFNTPVFRSLKQNFPEKKLLLVLNPVNYKLFETNPYIDEIILYDGRWKGFFKTLKILKTKQIDLSLILHSNEPQATPLAVLSNSKYIIKIPNDKNEYNIFHNNIPTKAYGNQHGIFDRLRHLEYLGIDENDPRTELFLKEEWNATVAEYFKKNNIDTEQDIIIGFQIGASTVSRMWFEERWTALGERLLQLNKNIKIVLTGSPKEKILTDPIKTKLNSKNVFDCAGVFDIGSAAVLIGKLDVLITPDTGPMHIAAALKVPTIGFFIAAKWYGSNPCHDKEIHLYIQKEQTCTPCIGKRCKFQECMYQITIDDVMDKIDILKIIS
jgi:ADP-heptose:LPS heptosyltransferase